MKSTLRGAALRGEAAKEQGFHCAALLLLLPLGIKKKNLTTNSSRHYFRQDLRSLAQGGWTSLLQWFLLAVRLNIPKGAGAYVKHDWFPDLPITSRAPFLIHICFLVSWFLRQRARGHSHSLPLLSDFHGRWEVCVCTSNPLSRCLANWNVVFYFMQLYQDTDKLTKNEQLFIRLCLAPLRLPEK